MRTQPLGVLRHFDQSTVRAIEQVYERTTKCPALPKESGALACGGSGQVTSSMK